MQVTGEKGEYRVAYDAATGTISCEGTLDLRGKEGYRPIAELFEKVTDEAPETITLDIRQLEFLNSSGITTIGSGLIIKARKKGASKMAVSCSKKYTWQERSIRGLSKLMPGMELKFDD
ncbi:hypothetical protein QUF80_22240 [Desulfococcaceae bacterium HSG8]|nr:hypothetical protein [Desulfococcaceae bacterium HSG8]